MGLVIFNGISSLDLGIQVELIPDYEFPEREYEVVQVPGRNGDVVIDKGSYKNTKRKYNVAIPTKELSFATVANALVGWLHSGIGYCRLEDSYEPEYYRLAMFRNSGLITNLWDQAGRLEVEFECKPQRFLKSGEVPIVYTAPGGLSTNLTSFPSKPLMRIEGTGVPASIYIGTEYEILIDPLAEGWGTVIYIDCEIENAYEGTINKNDVVSFTNGIPILKPGQNDIAFDNSILSVTITPRWWTI